MHANYARLLSVLRNQHLSPMPQWVLHLGAIGLFAVAIVDSSVIPLALPGSTDLLLLWLGARGGSPLLLVLGAVSGSMVGGYSTWQIGRRGGEAALRRYMPKPLRRRVIGWIERHRLLAVFLPALLPPPIPLAPFLLACGALGVSRNRFLAVFGAGRLLRYSLVVWLAVAYGRPMLAVWSGTLAVWSRPLIWAICLLVVLGLALGWVQLRKLKRCEAKERTSLPVSAGRLD